MEKHIKEIESIIKGLEAAKTPLTKRINEIRKNGELENLTRERQRITNKINRLKKSLIGYSNKNQTNIIY